MPRKLTLELTFDDGVTDEGAEDIKQELINLIHEDYSEDVKSVEVLSQQLRLRYTEEEK